MRFAIFKGEKSITDLVSRLFRIKGPASASAVKQAGDALIEANPHLADMGNMRAGSRIVVPDIPQPVNLAELTTTASVVSAGISGRFSQSLEAIKASIPNIVSAKVAAANQKLTLAQQPELQAAAAQDPVLAKRLAAITQQAKTDVQNAQSQQADILNAITQFQQNLGKLN